MHLRSGEQSFRASESNVSFVIKRLNHCFSKPKYAFQSAGLKDELRFCLATTKGFLEADDDDDDDDDDDMLGALLFVYGR